MIRTTVATVLTVLGTLAGAQAQPTPTPNIEEIRSLIQGVIEVTSGPRQFSAGRYAVLHTSAGDIVVRLNTSGAPRAVENFVALGTGKKPWTHPITRVEKTQPLYDNTLFYKVVPDALVFGGDPINRGEGDPGYSIDHEPGAIDDFSVTGVLAMQSNGPKANGSRFLITLRPFPEYEDRHTAIGRVVAGLDVVRTISNTTTKRPTIPLDPHVLYSMEILEVPEGKLARGVYTIEDGRPVLTLQRELTDAPNIPKTATADQPTTMSDSSTKATTGI